MKDSEFLIPQTTQERSQNFWSPKQPRRGVRISDPPNNKWRIQNFWSPKQNRRGFRISEPPNNTGEDSEFLTPQTIKEGSRISDFPSTQEINEPPRIQSWKQNFSLVPKQWNVTSSEVEVNSWFWRSARKWLFHDTGCINFIQSLVLHPIQPHLILPLKTGFSSCCLPQSNNKSDQNIFSW